MVSSLEDQAKRIPFFPKQRAEFIKNRKEKAGSEGSMGSGRLRDNGKWASKAFALAIIRKRDASGCQISGRNRQQYVVVLTGSLQTLVLLALAV